jgi:hypothetical protein
MKGVTQVAEWLDLAKGPQSRICGPFFTPIADTVD